MFVFEDLLPPVGKALTDRSHGEQFEGREDFEEAKGLHSQLTKKKECVGE